MKLNVELPGLSLKNPVMSASGCFGFGKEYAELYDLSILGGITLKSITLEKRVGNALPRVCETPNGMLNAIGLQNPGVHQVIKEELPRLKGVDTCVLANVAGASIEEYVEVVKILNDEDTIGAYELNISCPNVKEGGIAFGVDPKMAALVTSEVKKVAKKPVYVKLSPNVSDIVAIAKAVEEAGADGLVMINTLVGMRFDLHTGKPILANQTGGLSGPAILPVALRMVHEVAKNVEIPIIGVGGITSAKDVVEFLIAGASAVQVGAQNFVDPYACKKIVETLEETLKNYGYASIEDVIKRSLL